MLTESVKFIRICKLRREPFSSLEGYNSLVTSMSRSLPTHCLFPAFLALLIPIFACAYTPFNYGPQVPGMEWFRKAKFGEGSEEVRSKRSGRKEKEQKT